MKRRRPTQFVIDRINKGLHSALRPRKSRELSGVVLVALDGEVRCAYIKFDDSVIDILGKIMPLGVGEAHPAYICITKLKGEYVIRCCYVHDRTSMVLWKQPELPTWVKVIRRLDDGEDKSQAGRANP